VEDELELISRHVKLYKIPSHLVVILGNESISYRDLANIAVWCIAAGISFVSFYDHHGTEYSLTFILSLFIKAVSFCEHNAYRSTFKVRRYQCNSACESHVFGNIEHYLVLQEV
jgi:dehydrodolichyl diphosphate syntase complex subunit NUS1